MTYKDIKALAFFITSEDENTKGEYRDLFYDPSNKIFAHRSIAGRTRSYASTLVNGKGKVTRIYKDCIHVGRYHIDVNPEWIIEDMLCITTQCKP